MAEPAPKKEIVGAYELPEGWVWAALSEIYKPKITKDPKKNGPGRFIYLDIEAIDNEIQTIVKPRRLNNKKASSRAKRLVNSGDVIISLVRPYLKNIALIPEDLDSSIASTAFYPLKPENSIDSHYLFHAVCRQSPPSARDNEFIKIQIPLPPLPEQHEIVRRVETLFHSADDAEHRIAAATTHANRLTQSILAKAFRGELVPQDPGDEPASVLLERIRKERAELKEMNKSRKRRSKTLSDFN